MKIVLAPDKFKESLSSFEVCKAMEQGIKDVTEDISIFSFPMADGGDGFGPVMQHYSQTEEIECETVDPLFRKIKRTYQWDTAGKIAIIETASASGLVLLNKEERNPSLTSTLGTGHLILHAIDRGAKEIILGLGGTATNDAGIGILAALGFQFLDESNKPLRPIGKNLLSIKQIALPSTFPDIKFRIACDVTNPMFGTQGAAFVYAPQKGANENMVIELDRGLSHFAEIIESYASQNISSLPGTGAAGAIAAGLMAFFPVKMEKGIDMVIKASGIETELQNADLILTGEGKIDFQTKEGKVAGSIGLLAQKNNIPCIALCGILDIDRSAIKNLGLTDAFAISDETISIEESMSNAHTLIRKKIGQVIHELRTVGKR